MILSHKYKFIFIKTRKTAGSSIEYNLSKCLGEKDVLTPLDNILHTEDAVSRNYVIHNRFSIVLRELGLIKLSKYFRDEFNTHEHCMKIKRMIGSRIWNSYFKFCVEREPVDKCLSYYFMRKNSPYSKPSRKKMSWDHFVKKGNFPVDDDFYVYKNNLMVDKIIKFENLNSEFSEVLNYLNIKNVNLNKKVNNTFRETLDFEVTNDHKKVIYKAFRKTLPYTGYRLDKLSY